MGRGLAEGTSDFTMVSGEVALQLGCHDNMASCRIRPFLLVNHTAVNSSIDQE